MVDNDAEGGEIAAVLRKELRDAVRGLESALAELASKIQGYKNVAADPSTNRRFQELEQKKHRGEEELAQKRESLRSQIRANLENAGSKTSS